jgi:SAM-dependent methyltransferase
MISPFLEKMNKEGLLINKGNALDLGCGKGLQAAFLAGLGFIVDAVDIRPSVLSVENINITEADIREYSITEGKYSVIIANNVLPFLPIKKDAEMVIERMIKGLTPGGYAYFTLFGPKDGWAADPKMSFWEFEEAKAFIKNFDIQLYHESTEEGYGQKMNGEIKYWNIHKFLYKKGFL